MKKTILMALALLAMACTKPMGTTEYVDWLYESMPLPDSLSYTRGWWEANVSKTLEVREKMGWNVPEREFRHFVLPLRVNNETLDNFRFMYADTLCERVKGMSLAEAAIEINHWCHEQATYKPSDARTSSPMATMKNGVGRCGEESVLAVAALRAAGIPARQVYTPRWAHTDDNHAWVEVWVDGKWYFMGACEPEPRLNMAWFNAPVSRAMLLNTKVCGNYQGPEDVIQKTACYTEINAIRGYVPARRNIVTVTDIDGKPVEGARVEFKIYNYAEFYTVASYLSDAEGKAGLDTGCGDVFIWAAKDGRFGFAKASSETATVVLDHEIGEEFSADIDIVPPVEDPIKTGATEEEIADNARRLEEEDAIRASHDHINHDVEDFLASGAPHAKAIVSMLCDKDLCDVSFSVLEDLAVTAASEDFYVLSPRIGVEFLRPYRAEILASGIADRIKTAGEAIDWTRDSIKLIDGRNPQNLSTSPLYVWKSRTADVKGRNLFFVGLCRTLGIPARIDEITGKTQYREGGNWHDVNFGNEAAAATAIPDKGSLNLQYAGGVVRTPKYYRHFTISQILDNAPWLLEFGSDADDTPVTQFGNVDLDEGYYMMTTGSRMADGSVLAHMEFFNINKDSKTNLPLTLRQSETNVAVIGSMDAEQLFLKEGASAEQSLLSATGRGYFLLAVMGAKDEPSTHARIDLEASAEELNAWGRPLVILGEAKPAGLDKAIFGSDPKDKVLEMLLTGCERSAKTLPVITICDSFGRIVYFSQGYNTSLQEDLRRITSAL